MRRLPLHGAERQREIRDAAGEGHSQRPRRIQRNIRKAGSFRYYSGVDHSHSYLHTKAPLQSPAMTRLPEVVVAPPAPPAPAECKEIRSAPTLFGLDAFGVGFKVRCEHHAR